VAEVIECYPYAEFKRESIELALDDSLTAGLSGAYADLIESDPSFAHWQDKLAHERQEQGPFSEGHAVRLSRYLAQLDLLEFNPEPSSYPSRNMWRGILWTLYTDERRKREYEINYSHYNPITAKPGRYTGALFVAGLDAEPDQPYRRLDIGCGPNTGLAYEYAHMTPDLEELGPYLPKPPRTKTRQESDRVYDLLERASRRRFVEGYGVDVLHPKEDIVAKWGKACQTPQGLCDPHTISQRENLIAIRDVADEIKFVRADAGTDTIIGEPPARLGAGQRRHGFDIAAVPADFQADVVTANFIGYMLKQPEWQHAVDLMSTVGNRVLVLDAIDGTDTDTTKHPADQIHFAKSWNAWSFALISYDPQRPDLGWETLARFKAGDCREVRLGKALLQSTRKRLIA
jgi:hypothetical protein